MTPTNPLSDDQLDATLARFLRAEVEVIAARAQGERMTIEALGRRVGGTPSRRHWLLLAAALLLTSAAAFGLTAGGAMIQERSSSLATPSSLQAVPFATDSMDTAPAAEDGCPWPDTWARPMMSRTLVPEHCRR